MLFSPRSYPWKVAILKQLDHPHVVKCFETFHYNSSLYLVLEICSGSDLYSRDPCEWGAWVLLQPAMFWAQHSSTPHDRYRERFDGNNKGRPQCCLLHAQQKHYASRLVVCDFVLFWCLGSVALTQYCAFSPDLKVRRCCILHVPVIVNILNLTQTSFVSMKTLCLLVQTLVCRKGNCGPHPLKKCLSLFSKWSSSLHVCLGYLQTQLSR